MLIKITHLTKNLVEARGNHFLCLSSVILSVLAVGVFVIPVSAMAQNDPVYNVGTPNLAAQSEIRLQQMENQIRDLTGRVEEQIYEINSLKQKINRLEGGQGAIAPSAGVGQMGGASQIAPPTRTNPLEFDIKAQDPRGMRSTTVTSGSNDATAQYEKAYSELKQKNYEGAQQGFDVFLKAHSEHILAANAKYWLGETYYVRGDFKKAARVFAEGFQAYPESAKSPDILLKLALSLKGMGKEKDACVALEQIPVKFPTGNDNILERAQRERANLSCGA